MGKYFETNYKSLKAGRCGLMLLLFVAVGAITAPGATKKRSKPPPRKPAPASNEADDDAKTPVANNGKIPNTTHLLAPGELPLSAAGAIVIDGQTGGTLYEVNSDAPQFPASTTKTMTALLIIEAGN